MKPQDAALGRDSRLRPLLAVLQLASPGLPVGGFAYSQGLEQAIDAGLVHDAASAQRWIDDLLRLSLARLEAPLWLRAFDACARDDTGRLCPLERRADRLARDRRAARRVAADGRLAGAAAAGSRSGAAAGAPLAYAAGFAAACVGLGIDREAALAAYLWAWAENQVLVAVKTIPLGQQAGQSMLFALHDSLAAAIATAVALPDDELGSAAVQAALVSARHEGQYSRLFRS
jgi:urease accessory protein